MKSPRDTASLLCNLPHNWAIAMARIQLGAVVAITIWWSHATPVRAQNYENGIAAFKAGDFATALSEWRPLAKHGDARAQFDLGIMYEYGRGVVQNDVEALNWYRKAANQNVAAAQYRLAVLHENGWGVAQNHAEAVKWYSKAAAQGHALAQHDLAFMYFEGTGVPQDYIRAYMWLKISVVQGNSLMVKHLNLVAKNLTVTQIGKAQELARVWLRKQQ